MPSSGEPLNLVPSDNTSFLIGGGPKKDNLSGNVGAGINL